MDFSSISLGEILAIVTSITVLITWLWNGIGKPNKSQDEKIIRIQDTVSVLMEDSRLIKENHLKHIEQDIKGLREGMVRIETIIEERFPHR